MLLVCLLSVVAACGGDDGGVLVDPTTTTVRATTTTIAATTTTRVGGKTGQPPSTTVIQGQPFDAPQPTTTPNVSQPADTLLDGQHVAFMVDVDVAGRTVDVDVIQWILRPDFEAAIADGRLDRDDPCTDLDYCIANAQDRVRTMPVASDARVSVVDYDDCCGSVRTDSVADVLMRLREGRDLFVLTVAAGRITALDELYLA
jgi:hypothetical protein